MEMDEAYSDETEEFKYIRIKEMKEVSLLMNFITI